MTKSHSLQTTVNAQKSSSLSAQNPDISTHSWGFAFLNFATPATPPKLCRYVTLEFQLLSLVFFRLLLQPRCKGAANTAGGRVPRSLTQRFRTIL